ncbi:putative Pyrimidine-specific ribonucleoside hydrolase RihA [Cocos nucifera]|uniref:Putative Pyrimidine-specific ribonucleoside hydrolase RihA n=1 Tax=Cocos nucifera TaxID=13894 RepID=A0A8K0HWW0_COCNU|nr:putative Pyrimidine-specific ribonucleoside hydrolase RihA [Cocos nucifera]
MVSGAKDEWDMFLGSTSARGSSGPNCPKQLLLNNKLSFSSHNQTYTAENSVKFGAPRNTDHPELRQPLAMEVWQSITRELNPSDKITLLTNGPLTNLANIVLSDENASSIIQNVYIVGGHIVDERGEKGNVFTVPSNEYAEFNMFLDPLAAKKVIESDLQITLIPLSAQRKVISFKSIRKNLKLTDETPEALFADRLLSLMQKLQRQHRTYLHMDIFLGEILGAVFLADGPNLSPAMQIKPVSVLAGNITKDGQMVINRKNGKLVSILNNFNSEAYYGHFAHSLGDRRRSAVVGSFDEQEKKWSMPPNQT